MKRIEKFNEEMKKFDVRVSLKNLTNTVCIEDLENQIKTIENVKKLLPIPSEIAGIEISRYFEHYLNSCNIAVQNVSNKITVKCYKLYTLEKLIKLLTVETKNPLTTDGLRSRQDQKFTDMPFDEKIEMIIEALQIALNETRTRLDFLNEEVS